MKGRTTVIAAFLALFFTATAAFSASITFSSKHLAAATLSVPVFYPNSVVAANLAAVVRKPEKNDTLTVVYSAQMDASTLCGGAPTVVGTLSASVAITITSNAAPSGNDQLAIPSVGTGICSGDGILHFGTVDLGSTGYVTSGTTTFSASTFTLTQTSTSATIIITLGTASGSVPVQVATGTAAIYTPDPVLADTVGNSIGVSTAVTAATTQF